MIFADRIMQLGFKRSGARRHFVRHGRHGRADEGPRLLKTPASACREYEQQYADRPHHPRAKVQQGCRRLVEVHRQGRADAMMEKRSVPAKDGRLG